MFKIEILLSCHTNYSRQCEGKVKKEVVKSNIFAFMGFFRRDRGMDNVGPAFGHTIGLILSTAAHSA